MGVAGTAEQLAASLVQNREGEPESLQTHVHQIQKICIYQPVFGRVARISAFGFFSDPHVCQRGLLIELPQWLPALSSIDIWILHIIVRELMKGG